MTTRENLHEALEALRRLASQAKQAAYAAPRTDITSVQAALDRIDADYVTVKAALHGESW